MPVVSVAKFERFFRAAAGLDVDKNDLKRYSDFVNQKTGGTDATPFVGSAGEQFLSRRQHIVRGRNAPSRVGMIPKPAHGGGSNRPAKTESRWS